MKAVLATICDGHNQPIARLQASNGDGDLLITIAIDTGYRGRWKSMLHSIGQDVISLGFDNVLRVAGRNSGTRKSADLDTVICTKTTGKLHLVYNPAGIETFRDMKAQLQIKKGEFVPAEPLSSPPRPTPKKG